MFNNAKQVSVSLEVMVNLLTEVEVDAVPLEVGGCTSYRINHPKYGEMILVQTPISDECLAFSI